MNGTPFHSVFLPERIARGSTNVRPLHPVDEAAWVWADGPDADPAGVFYRFRCDFEARPGQPLRLHASGDERFVLLLDGVPFGEGPTRGLVNHWHVVSYEAPSLPPGPHRLEAVVWRLGGKAPLAQLTVRGAFVLKADGDYEEALSTGKAPWKAARLTGTDMTAYAPCGAFGAGAQCLVRGTSCMDECPPDAAFAPVVVVRDPIPQNRYGLHQHNWMAFPTILPDQMFVRLSPGILHDEAGGPDFAPGPFEVPAHTTRTLFWDLGDYYCAYPDLVVSGGSGASIRWGWTEALRDPATGRKVHRDLWKGLSFLGLEDEFRPDGRAHGRFSTPWWRCGRWVRLVMETADEPLRVERLAFNETRYPLENEASFECDDPSLEGVQRICLRALRMCAHEMFFDCPFYEQQMYPGDTRIQMQVFSAVTRDDRLVRHALTLLDADRREDGTTGMNLPTRGTQESLTYTFCWLLMLADYMRTHADDAWFRARLPGMRHALFGAAVYENADGFLENLPGWSFVDWVPSWKSGNAPCGQPGQGVSSINNLFYVYALRGAAEVEAAIGETHLAAHWTAKADTLSTALVNRFWCDERGLLADTDAKDTFSEHAQCLAILAGVLPPEKRARAWQGLLDAPDLARATVYFSHYLFDVYALFGRTDLFLRRLDLWREYVALGLKTTLEQPDSPDGSQSRSDCHAWGAHPLYHLQRAVAGITPAAPFFRAVRVAPQPGPLRFLRSTSPVPQGLVTCDLAFDGTSVRGSVTLPEGLPGVFAWRGIEVALHAGRNDIAL